MNKIAMISTIVFGAIGMSIASAGVYAQGGQYASAPQTTYEFEEIGEISEETDKILLANNPIWSNWYESGYSPQCGSDEYNVAINAGWNGLGGCWAKIMTNDNQTDVLINFDAVAVYDNLDDYCWLENQECPWVKTPLPAGGVEGVPFNWGIGAADPDPAVPGYNKDVGGATTGDDQLIAGCKFTFSGGFEGDCNEINLGLDSQEHDAVAIGVAFDTDKWPYGYPFCTGKNPEPYVPCITEADNKSTIDVSGSAIAEGGPGAWICSLAGCNEDSSLKDPDGVKVAGGFGPGAWFKEDPTATDDPAVVGGWSDGLYLEDESHIGYAIVGQGCPNIPGVVCNDNGTIIGSPVPLYNADGNCLIAGGCSNDSAGISGAESVAGGGWGGLGCWICNEDDGINTELFDDGN